MTDAFRRLSAFMRFLPSAHVRTRVESGVVQEETVVSSVDCLRVLFCYRLAALLLLAVFALAINRVSLWCGVGSRYTRSASPLANSTLTGWKSRISLFVHLPQVAN
uniref:Secreted protein n=1 Tax=Mesocestoides corti TaxID=53468 RepID=A0A5K3G6X8_MESCO